MRLVLVLPATSVEALLTHSIVLVFCSFDDSSSISSGDISDTIGDISTDENLGSSQSACSDYNNPYGSLKRKPINIIGQKQYGKNYNTAVGYDYTAWRKYSVPESHNYVNLDYSSEPDTSTLTSWRKERNDYKPGYYATSSLRRNSNIEHIKLSAENLLSQSHGKQRAPPPNESDQSMIIMRKTNHQVTTGMPMSTFGYRRPVSGLSNNSEKAPPQRPVAGKPPTSKAPLQPPKRNGLGRNDYENIYTSPDGSPRRCSMVASKTQTGLSSSATVAEVDAYKSNTLGRRKPDRATGQEKLYASGSNLNKAASNDKLCSSTIISNPHAAYTSRYQAAQRNGAAAQNGADPGRELAREPRERSMSIPNPTHPQTWLKSSAGTTPNLSESMESLSSAGQVQAKIQQARAHGMASRSILSGNRDSYSNRDSAAYGPMERERSDSMKSSKSDRLYQTLSQHLDADIPRTTSIGHLNAASSCTSQPVSPTPSVGSQNASRFTYPMTALSPNHVSTSASNHSLARSLSQQSNLPYAGMLPLSKSGSRDEEGEFTAMQDRR